MSTYETTAGLGDERVRILPRRGLVKNHYYARATHGSWRLCGAIVVISWRGGDAERYKSQTRDETFVSEAISDDSRTHLIRASSDCAAKLLLFSDMAMGWSGLRAVLVRIACMCPND